MTLVLELSVLSGLIAQEPSAPAKNETPSPTPNPANTRPQLNIPDIPLPVEPPTLVPEDSPTSSKPRPGSGLSKNAPPLSQLDDAFKRSPMGQAAEEQRLHREWRELQNRVANDPDVVAAKAATKRTRTDLERREQLRAYYNVYYAHMQALASTPEVKKYLEGKKAVAIQSLAQPRVRAANTPQPSPKR